MTLDHIQELVLEKLPFRYFPLQWKDKNVCRVFVEAYQLCRPTTPLRIGEFKQICEDKFCLTLLRGNLNLQSPIRYQIFDENVICEADFRENTVSEEGHYFIIALPIELNSSDSAGSRQISELVGLFQSFYGRNGAYRKLFSYEFNLIENSQTSYSAAILHPGALPPCDISDQELRGIVDAWKKIQLSETQASRLKLSLRWLNNSVMEDNGPDAFIKLWIALEVLAMPESTNISPINELLASAYSITIDQARSRFRIGPIFGLRSQIVHDGTTPDIDHRFLDYLRAVYLDCLHETLRIPCPRKAEELLAVDDFELNKFLSRIFSN